MIFSVALLILLLLLIMASNCYSDSLPIKRRNLLVLNSYHWGAEWAEGEVSGLTSVFKESQDFLEIYIEQMDVLRRSSPIDDAFFADFLQQRYGALRFDLLVVTDDAALRFAAENYRELFAGIPVVFSDVSSLEGIEFPPEMPVTGVLEHRDFRATVELARRLRPKATQIIVFGNAADTGAGPRTAQTFLNELKLDIPVRIINDLTLEEIIEAASRISSVDILIPLALAYDRHGIRYTYEEVNKAISSVVSTPIFNFWSLGIKGGYVLGGKVNDPMTQGSVAARLGLRIFGGEDARSIPIVSKAPTEYLFNYDLMKRYGIAESALPEGSSIVGKPVSLYEEYKVVILTTLFVVLSLLMVIFVLLVNIGWRRRAEEALRDSEERYRNLFEKMTLGVVYQAADGRIITANPAAESILGLSKEQLLGRSSMDPRWRAIHEDGSEFPGSQHPAMLSLHSGKAVNNVIMGVFHPSANEYRWLLIDAVPEFRPGESSPKRVFATFTDITERRRAEAERVWLFNVLETSLNEIYIFDAKSLLFRYVNQGARRNLGYSREAILTKTPLDLKTEFDEGSFRELIAPLIARHREKLTFYTVHRRANDSLYPVEVHLQLTEYGNRQALAATILDITAREQAENALRESEAKYRRLHESMRDAFAQTDMAGYVQESNRAFQEMLGYTEDELRGLNYRDFTPEKWHALEAHILQEQVLPRDYSEVFEKEYIRKDGTVFPIELRVFLIRDQTGEPQSMWAIVRDITERKRSEQALHASMAQIKTVITAAPIVLFSCDREGLFTLSEGKGLEGLGLKPGEAVGQSVLEMYPDIPEVAECVRQAIAGETFTTTLRLEGRELLAYHTPLRGQEGGEIEGTIGVLVDTSERARAEEALNRLNEELEQRVELRTVELAASNRQLKQALSRLRRTQQELVRREKLASLGALVAGVAHELSTPLGNSLTAASALADKTREFSRQLRNDAQNRASLEAFLQLITQATHLLTSSLLQAGELIQHFKQVAVDQTSAQRRQFDLAEVIDEIMATLQPQIKKTPHKITIDIPPGIEMDSYPGPLGQIITNLVSNAVIHGFTGDYAGEIRIEAVVLDDKEVRLTVRDSGIGIPTESLSRIFDPFFTTRIGQGGSGLGLHIVYSLCTRVLGGQIDVHSKPDKGTWFLIDLPLCAPRQAAGSQTAALTVESRTM